MPFDALKREDLPRNPVLEHLKLARQIISITGLWCKDSWCEFNEGEQAHASCAADAVHCAIFGYGYRHAVAEMSNDEICEYEDRLGEMSEFTALAAFVPKKQLGICHINPMEVVVAFNDHKLITIDHVLGMFDGAIAEIELRTQINEEVPNNAV